MTVGGVPAQDAIVDPDVWWKVEAKLNENRSGRRVLVNGELVGILRGKVFDNAGNLVSPVRGTRRGGPPRYYVSRAAHDGRHEEAGSVPRMSAGLFEETVFAEVPKALCAGPRGPNWQRELHKVNETDRRTFMVSSLRRLVVGSGEPGPDRVARRLGSPVPIP